MNADRLAHAASRIGETVLDPALWPEVMASLCAALDTTGAILLQTDARTMDVPRTASFAEATAEYFRDSWHLSDARVRLGLPKLLAGSSVVTDQDLFVDERDLLKEPFYADLLARYGFRWCAGLNVRAGDALWVLTFQRTVAEGPFDADVVRLLSGLSRQLSEVATLSDVAGRIALTSATQAFEALRRPTIAIDRAGLVLEVNASAAALFDDAFRVRDRRLAFSDRNAARALDQLVDRIRATPDIGSMAVAPISVQRQGRRPLLLSVLPVHPAARNPFLGARALLVISTFDRPESGPEPALLAKLFGLTAAEARVASLIARGLDPSEIADTLGVSRETVRSQLKATYQKLGIRRQGELAVLLLGAGGNGADAG